MFGKEHTMLGIVLHFLTGIAYRQDMKPFQNRNGGIWLEIKIKVT